MNRTESRRTTRRTTRRMSRTHKSLAMDVTEGVASKPTTILWKSSHQPHRHNDNIQNVTPPVVTSEESDGNNDSSSSDTSMTMSPATSPATSPTTTSISNASPSILKEANPYLEKIRQKRKLNEEKLNELGLNNNITRKVKRTRHKKIRIHKEVVGSPPLTRRSARSTRKPVLFTGEELDSIYANSFTTSTTTTSTSTSTTTNHNTNPQQRKQPNSTTKKIKRRTFDLGDQISEEKRMKYDKIPHQEWVDDLKYYFKVIQGNSDSNVYRVVRVVEKLVCGFGIRHPMTGEYFKKNVDVRLSDDFRLMLDEASEWVYDNGGDRGNGWLIEHPVKKCFVYQQARAEKGSAFSSDSSSP